MLAIILMNMHFQHLTKGDRLEMKEVRHIYFMQLRPQDFFSQKKTDCDSWHKIPSQARSANLPYQTISILVETYNKDYKQYWISFLPSLTKTPKQKRKLPLFKSIFVTQKCQYNETSEECACFLAITVIMWAIWKGNCSV